MKSLNPILILRLGAGLCFIGHGILALTAKAKFVELLATFGIEQQLAVGLLLVIGCLDVLVGLLILFKPTKPVLQWAMIWTGLTIAAWAFHGDTLMDLMRRAPYVTTPFALLVLLYGKVGKTTPVEGEAAIAKLDLSMICMKLMDKHDGEGWTEQQCAEVAEEYRRYLKLKLLYPDANIVPNLAIDTLWHYHILDTQAYYRDCHAIFGHILHHYPYFGVQGKADEKQFMSAFDRTKLLYRKTFSVPMEGPNYLSSFRG